MSIHQSILIFFAGLLGAMLNAVAGGGSFIGFPTLLFAGVPAVPANISNNIAMMMGSVTSSGAYRDRLDVSRRILIPLVTVSILGGIVGAVLLLKTPAHAFVNAVPWLMLSATLLFIFGRRLTGLDHLTVDHKATKSAIITTSILHFFTAIYGGYFGAGMSIVILAMLSAAGMANIHAMNAFKAVLQVAVTGVASLYFIFAKAVSWPQACVMIVGAMIGGYAGAHFAKRMPQARIRQFVIVVAIGMTAYLFVKTYYL